MRQRVGLFDVSHMGEIEIRGPEALRLVNYVATNDASRAHTGQAQYSGLLYEHGGFVDDILVHKVADDHYFLCVNASNQDKDYEHIVAHNQFDATVENRRIALCAARRAGSARARYSAEADAGSARAHPLLSFCRWRRERSAGAHRPHRLHRRRRFRDLLAPADAPRIWEEILAAGAEFGIKPCGLGARNTLRLEAQMALYGHEIHAPSRRGKPAGLDRQNGQGRFRRRAALWRSRKSAASRANWLDSK